MSDNEDVAGCLGFVVMAAGTILFIVIVRVLWALGSLLLINARR